MCLTINDDNIKYTHVLPPSQGATTSTITAASFDPFFDTEQQRSEFLTYPIRFLSDHRSIPMNSVRIRVRQAVRNQLWEELSSEKEIKVDLPYSTAAAATAEVIIVIESDVYDAVGHGNEWWMDGWMDGWR